MPIKLPLGFRAAGVYCGIKDDSDKYDLSLIVADTPAAAAGVYTQNLVCAAPVVLDRERTPGESIRAIIINAGVANACTGDQGMQDAQAMAGCVAEAIDAEEHQVLVMSTGVIGEMLPMEKIRSGVRNAASELGRSEDHLIAAARGIMTTDTTHKLAGRLLDLDGCPVRVTGMSKGAAMIGPNMATMLGVVLTDAPMTADEAQSALTQAVDASFNCISVEGHTSTNDTVLLLASGEAGKQPLTESAKSTLRKAIREVCEELARAIIADGEGATHRIEIEVNGCRTADNARTIAKTVANSPLVKTAITGADPNWGRIVSAAGYSGVAFDPGRVRLTLNGALLYDEGAPVAFDAAAVSKSIASNRDIEVVLTLGEGDATSRFWTTDLTAEYIRLNAEYHT